MFGELASRNFETMWVMVRLLGMASIVSGQQKIQHKGEFIELKPGQVLTSLDELSFGGKLDMQKIRRALHHLEKRQTICQSSDNKGRLITICNWEKYQYRSTSDDKQDASETQSNDNQMTIKRQHIEELKNIRSKEVEENKTPSTSSENFNSTKDFDLVQKEGPAFTEYLNFHKLHSLKKYLVKIIKYYQTVENLREDLNQIANAEKCPKKEDDPVGFNRYVCGSIVNTINSEGAA